MKKDRQRKVQEQLVGIIFILILFLFLIINIIVPNKEKSVQENRMLATKPKFRLSSLISGDYDDFEDVEKLIEFIRTGSRT